MYLFGGWDYESILAMVDDLAYSRRYGGFLDIINSLTVRELVEIFNVIHNKENKKHLEETVTGSHDANLNTGELSPEVFDFLMNT